jgi:hypothetical protein
VRGADLRRVPVGQRVGVEDGTTHQPSVSLTHQSSRPGSGGSNSPRSIPKTGSSTTRSARSVSATAYSIAVWKVRSRARASTVVIVQSRPSTGGVHHRLRSQHWSMLETPIHHMAREPIRSTTEVARVTLRHTRRSEYLEVPSTGWTDRSRGQCLVGGTPLPSAPRGRYGDVDVGWDWAVRSAETSAATSAAISIARTASGDWEDLAGQWR